jgi:hypothetical protein
MFTEYLLTLTHAVLLRHCRNIYTVAALQVLQQHVCLVAAPTTQHGESHKTAKQATATTPRSTLSSSQLLTSALHSSNSCRSSSSFSSATYSSMRSAHEPASKRQRVADTDAASTKRLNAAVSSVVQSLTSVFVLVYLHIQQTTVIAVVEATLFDQWYVLCA